MSDNIEQGWMEERERTVESEYEDSDRAVR